MIDVYKMTFLLHFNTKILHLFTKTTIISFLLTRVMVGCRIAAITVIHDNLTDQGTSNIVWLVLKRNAKQNVGYVQTGMVETAMRRQAVVSH